MANVTTFLLPQEQQIIISPDGYASGHAVRLFDTGAQPSEFQTISASTDLVLGPYNEPRKYRITLISGSYTSTESFQGASELDLGGFTSTITTPSAGDVPVYDDVSGRFLNAALTTLVEGTPIVSLTTPSARQTLLYNTGGSIFVNGFTDAADVSYDHTISGLTSTDVKTAIDEVEANGVTLANSLSAVATSGASPDVTYDNGVSGLSSTDVKAAIDEVYANFANYTLTSGLGTMATETASDYSLISSLGTGAFATIANYALQADLMSQANNVQASNLAASGAGPYTIQKTDGISHKITVSHNCTLAFAFTTGKVESMTVALVNAGAFTVTWPVGMLWAGGAHPTFTSSGTDLITVFHDGANILYGIVLGQAFA